MNAGGSAGTLLTFVAVVGGGLLGLAVVAGSTGWSLSDELPEFGLAELLALAVIFGSARWQRR